MRNPKEHASEAASLPPPGESPPLRRAVRRAGRIPVHAVVVGIAALWLLPTIALLVSSFRARTAVTASGWWRIFWNPADFTLRNYLDVLTQNNMARSFLNSIIIAVPGTVLPIFVAALAAYAFAWMDFPGAENHLGSGYCPPGGTDPGDHHPGPAALYPGQFVRHLSRDLAGAHRLWAAICHLLAPQFL